MCLGLTVIGYQDLLRWFMSSDLALCPPLGCLEFDQFVLWPFSAVKYNIQYFFFSLFLYKDVIFIVRFILGKKYAPIEDRSIS